MSAKLPWLLAVVIVVAVGAILVDRFFNKPIEEREESGVLLHLTTQLGEKALPFTLADSEGTGHRVTPGGGTPHILIFHMGTQ
jgi:uncharacterized membrane protein YqiK